jgi:hypothetical protein
MKWHLYFTLALPRSIVKTQNGEGEKRREVPHLARRGCERPRGCRSAGSRASLAVAGTGRGGGGSPVGEATTLCRGGGICSFNGLELCLGRSREGDWVGTRRWGRGVGLRARATVAWSSASAAHDRAIGRGRGTRVAVSGSARGWRWPRAPSAIGWGRGARVGVSVWQNRPK